MSREFATIITDASWYSTNGSASWAGAVIHDTRRAEYAGTVRDPVASSQEAELIAVVNTLHHALHSGVLPIHYGWLIQSDNLHIVNLLNFHFQDAGNKTKPKRAPATSPLMLRALQHLHDYKNRAEPKFILARHIKGHVRAADREPRHHVQERMDRLAAQHRKKT